MATTIDFLEYIKESLSALDDIKFKMMMGEYIIYYQGKYVACICDNRLLVKDIPTVHTLILNPIYEVPYSGAKPMILITETDNEQFLIELFNKLYLALPFPKERKKTLD